MKLSRSFLAVLILGLHCVTNCHAQQISSLTIINKENNDPVAYTEVSTGSVVYYADVNGLVELTVLPKDTLLISRVGYISQKIALSKLRDTIKFEPFKIELREVNIRADPLSIETGFHRSNIIGWIGSMKSSTSRTLATFIKSDSLSGTIEYIFVRVKNQLKGTKYLLSIFETGQDLKPGKLLYETAYTSDHNKNLLKINVLNAGVEFSEQGVHIGIRVLKGGKEEGAYIKLTKTYGPPISHFLYQNMWFELDNLNPEYNLTYRIGLGIRTY